MSLIIFKNNLHNLRNEEISSQTGNKFHSNFNSSRTIKMIENRKKMLYVFYYSLLILFGRQIYKVAYFHISWHNWFFISENVRNSRKMNNYVRNKIII